MLFGQGDVGQRVLDVSSPLGAINRRAGVGGQLLQELEGFVEGDAASCGDIEDLSDS